jgi:hypothetical protein
MILRGRTALPRIAAVRRAANGPGTVATILPAERSRRRPEERNPLAVTPADRPSPAGGTIVRPPIEAAGTRTGSGATPTDPQGNDRPMI